jgi:hypothetical protein
MSRPSGLSAVKMNCHDCVAPWSTRLGPCDVNPNGNAGSLLTRVQEPGWSGGQDDTLPDGVSRTTQMERYELPGAHCKQL